MKKGTFTYLIISLCVVIIISILFISYFNIQSSKYNNEIISSKISDECTKEWEEYIASIEKITEASSNEKIVTPNSKILFTDYYKSCGHTETTEEKVSEEIVNMNEKQLEEKYADYDIEDFLKEEIKLYKEIDGLCDKHYLLIEEEGYVEIYKLENNGDKTLAYKTNISSEYLTDMDRVQLKQGIYVYGEDELNKTLEDFE